MADITTHDTEMTRGEAAALLRSIADELDAEQGAVLIPVGNKDVRLSPPETISVEATVTERSRRIRKDVETVSLELAWNPTADVAESDPLDSESDPEFGLDSGAEPEPDR